MNDFRINFILKPPVEIAPWGEKGDYLSWFGLTDSELWITVGEHTIYEYTDAACKEWNHDIPHNDYYLSRFLEDFSETFAYISEEIPEKFYNQIEKFRDITNDWLELYAGDDDCDDEITDEDIDSFDRFYDEKYQPLTEWFHNRVFDSGHLTGGPLIGCFRCGETLKIWWYGDDRLENGENIWTAPSGFFELPYADFVSEVKRFFHEFYAAMDKQVETSLQMDWDNTPAWGKVNLDKKYLAKEHKERKKGFDREIALLDENVSVTDWNKVEEMFEIMKKELKTEG